MIICRYNGEIHCISETEDFRELVAPEIFDALHEFLKIKEHDAEEYENLEREYDRLYDELEDTKSELEDAEAEVDRLEEENDSLSDKLSSISFEKPLAMEEDQAYFLAERAANKNVRGYKMSLGKEENITSTKLRVDMYFGEKNYAKIICVDDIPKDANTLSDIREIYGRNLLMYPYNSVRYYIDGSTNKTFATKGYATAILFQVPFLRHWGISNGSGEVEVRITKDGPIVSPVARTCEIAGKRIEPIKEPIKKIRVCGEHTSEKDQIKEMVQLIRGISEMCQNIKNNNEQLRSRVEKLEAALF